MIYLRCYSDDLWDGLQSFSFAKFITYYEISHIRVYYSKSGFIYVNSKMPPHREKEIVMHTF